MCRAAADELVLVKADLEDRLLGTVVSAPTSLLSLIVSQLHVVKAFCSLTFSWPRLLVQSSKVLVEFQHETVFLWRTEQYLNWFMSKRMKLNKSPFVLRRALSLAGECLTLILDSEVTPASDPLAFGRSA